MDSQSHSTSVTVNVMHVHDEIAAPAPWLGADQPNIEDSDRAT